jgi:hypothetical protein
MAVQLPIVDKFDAWSVDVGFLSFMAVMKEISACHGFLLPYSSIYK